MQAARDTHFNPPRLRTNRLIRSWPRHHGAGWLSLFRRRNSLVSGCALDEKEYAFEPGMLNSISVPAPCALQTFNLPPIRAARSRIPARP